MNYKSILKYKLSVNYKLILIIKITLEIIETTLEIIEITLGYRSTPKLRIGRLHGKCRALSF